MNQKSPEEQGHISMGPSKCFGFRLKLLHLNHDWASSSPRICHRNWRNLVPFSKHLFSKPFVPSVQFSHSVVSNSLRPHESQHARPPCPSPTPGVHSDSRPSSRWCYPAISSSVVPFSSCPQSHQASESFPMSQLFAWGGLSTGVSALASFLPKNTQGWSPSEWTGWISLQSKGLSGVFLYTFKYTQLLLLIILFRWLVLLTRLTWLSSSSSLSSSVA